MKAVTTALTPCPSPGGRGESRTLPTLNPEPCSNWQSTMPVIRPTIEGREERGEGRGADCWATCTRLGHIHVGADQQSDPENHRCHQIRHRPARGEIADRAVEGVAEEGEGGDGGLRGRFRRQFLLGDRRCVSGQRNTGHEGFGEELSLQAIAYKCLAIRVVACATAR